MAKKRDPYDESRAMGRILKFLHSTPEATYEQICDELILDQNRAWENAQALIALRLIYVCRWMRLKGKPRPVFRAGDLPSAERPSPIR